jgi:hypothetical protein
VHRYAVNGAALFLLVLLLMYNAPLVHARSGEWGDGTDSAGMRLFLKGLKAAAPNFSDGAHILVDEPFTGRAYMYRALRAFYQHGVVYVHDPSKLNPETVPALYLVENRIAYGQGVSVRRVK